MWAILLKPIFGDLENFKYCFRYNLIPDVFSWYKGRYIEDLWSEFKIFVWMFSGIVVYFIFSGYGFDDIIAFKKFFRYIPIIF